MADQVKHEPKHETKHEAPKTEGPKKKDNTLKIVLIVVGVIVGLMIISGILFSIFVGSIINRAGKNIKVDKDGDSGSINIKTNDGQGSINYGENAKLPDGFPTDVPLYEPSTTVHASKTSDKQYSAGLKTNSSVSDVVAYYRSELAKQGWESTHESSYADGAILNFKKGDRVVTLSVSNQKDEQTEKTFISISVITKS